MSKLIVQKHHIIYPNEEHKQKEEIVKIFKGEHWLLTNLHRRKNISKGFIRDLEVWLALNKDKAIEL